MTSANPHHSENTSNGSSQGNMALEADGHLTHTDSENLRQLIGALKKVRQGDFSVRLPENLSGIYSELADAFNDVIEMNVQQQAKLLAESKAELERFAHLVSHDLQEPLNTMSSYSQLLVRVVGDNLDENAREYLRFIQEGAKRLKSLVKGLLTYSQMKSESTQSEWVDMNGVVEKVIKDLDFLIKEAAVQVTCDELPTIKGDKLRLSQVILNLVTNAIKFRSQERVPNVHIGVKESSESWEFYVADNGIGINKKYLAQIFVMFKRLHTHDLYEGSGVGLAICKKILGAHGGSIRVESEEGKGTKVLFYLPILGDESNRWTSALILK